MRTRNFPSALIMLAVIAPATSLLTSSAKAQGTASSTLCGRFVGAVQAEWIDGRLMRLTAPFSFLDPSCVSWSVPSGTKVDGASIPSFFWSVIGGPFEGNYRQASVIHDYYCDQKTRDWRSVHRVFYQGMLAAGTDPVKAKIMYFAVLLGGPRWKTVTYSNHPPRMFPKPGDIDRKEVVSYSGAVDEELAKDAIQKIEKTPLSLDEIEHLAERNFRGSEPPDTVRTDQ